MTNCTQINYSYANCVDSEYVPDTTYKHISRVAYQMTTPGGTRRLSYNMSVQCTSLMPSGCKQQTTATAPSNDNTVFNFMIYMSDGAQAYEAGYYKGLVSPANLLLTHLETWARIAFLYSLSTSGSAPKKRSAKTTISASLAAS